MAEILEFKIPTMATIKETAKMMNEIAEKMGVENGLTEFRIRELALTKQIVHVRAGNKILINIDKLIDFLNSGSDFKKPEKTDEKYTTISKIKK